jgi:hypothetical protein
MFDASHGHREVGAYFRIRVLISPQTRKRASLLICLLFRKSLSVRKILKVLLNRFKYSFDCRTLQTGIAWWSEL